jgi:hypothetical protein
VHCPKCKEWKAFQERLGDITLKCFVCGRDWTVSAKRRISHHRHDGDWDVSASGINLGRPCEPCEKDPNRLRVARKRLAEWRYASFSRSDERESDRINGAQKLAEEMGFLNAATAFEVSTDPDYYASLINYGSEADSLGENELVHFMQERHHLDVLGTNDPHVLLQIAGALAIATDPTNIIQRSSGSNVMKIDVETGLVVILTKFRAPRGSWRIRTAYITDDLEVYMGNM